MWSEIGPCGPYDLPPFRLFLDLDLNQFWLLPIHIQQYFWTNQGLSVAQHRGVPGANLRVSQDAIRVQTGQGSDNTGWPVEVLAIWIMPPLRVRPPEQLTIMVSLPPGVLGVTRLKARVVLPLVVREPRVRVPVEVGDKLALGA